MLRFSIITGLSLCLVSAVWAQSQKLPPDIASLPEDIKSLKWQTIDVATITPLEKARSLLLMDHVLSELSANNTSEADLMSAYIEKQNLGSQFTSTPAPPAPKQLSFDDGQKIAVALLRGPMSNSYYATELGDTPANQLASYAQMYQRTCQRKWSEFDEARHQVRSMGSFLGNTGKLQDYDAWATAESAARQKQYDQHAAASPAPQQNPAAQQQSQAQMQALQQQNQQLTQALGAAEYQAQQTPQVQQTPQAQTGGCAGGYAPGYVGAPVYGGYGAYGAYGGAVAVNAANDAQRNAAAKGAAAGTYHANNSTWNKDASYTSAAHAQTEQRMNNFHGAPARGGRR